MPRCYHVLIYNDSKHLRTSGLVQWLYDLQLHRVASLQHLNAILPPSQDASQVFGKLAKAVGLLPIFSFHPKQIAISNTGLQDLLNSGGMRELENNFFDCFPGIVKYHNGLRRQFSNYIRTDGVSCSLTFADMRLPELITTTKRKRSTASDVVKPPILPQPNQRIVAIDPGRRDMIAAVVPGDAPFKVSLKSYNHAAKTTKTTSYTNGLLDRAKCSDGSSLRSKLEALPSKKDISEWKSYIEVVIPLLKDILATYLALGLRRWKFRAYIFRDKTLDKICHRITSPSKPPSTSKACAENDLCSTTPTLQSRLHKQLDKVFKQITSSPESTLSAASDPTNSSSTMENNTSSSMTLPTLVAFGAANSCSTGFGYAPAPQARLRRRLEKIHGAYVCLIDEFRTSKCCCSCRQQLKAGVASSVDIYGQTHHRKEIHGVRYCESCRNDKGAKQFWHRDYNAAVNIFSCYFEVASGRKRPHAFDRSFPTH